MRFTPDIAFTAMRIYTCIEVIVMTEMTKTILLVEDDTIIASGLVYALKQNGYAATHCSTVSDAAQAIKHAVSPFDLAVLDMQLPDGTGFDVRELLQNTPTAIIFLTVIDDEGNIVRAFDSGADDYITKPFRLHEFLARVRRTLQSGSTAQHNLTIGNGITIDTLAGRVYHNNNLLELTALEYRLLLTFAHNRGQVISRTQILDSIWDSAGNFVEDNTLSVYIKRLREKLPMNIETIRGRGYRVD